MKSDTTKKQGGLSQHNHECKRHFSVEIPLLRIALFTTVMALAGCAPLHSDLLPKDRPMMAPQSNSGMVIASLGYRYGQGAINRYLPTTSLEVTVPSLSDPDAKPLLVTTNAYMRYYGAWGDQEVVRASANGKRVLVGYSIPAGHYRLGETTARLFGAAEWRVTVRASAAQQFTVEPGEIVYIGSHELDSSTGNNWLGMPVPAKAVVRVLDEFEDDKALLYRVRPELKSAPIRDAFVDGGKVGAPMMANLPSTSSPGSSRPEDVFDRAVNARAAASALIKPQSQATTQ
ncbi:hypothetical protein N5I87_15615 [Ralstonia sp. CHL-2022]|uniref:Uncharacterized protein n=1 Tax=Ralstonia mojiangensis TaxID=2953895 RepID=A0AAE3LBW3_9RALS|nr:hypothetical protein [Ralstonia mojiangensis]MCT7317435.1 hypothetical protein [Ralstonia mojiangensis]